jgi:hypothetical protein
MREVTALIFVEGDTEEEFYQVVCDGYLGGVRKKVLNLGGNFNIHKKVLDKTFYFLDKHPKSMVRVYCCIDRESRDHNPPLDVDFLIETINKKPGKRRILSVDKIIATQMIESWFFHDIEGIYKFLSIPKSLRKYHKFRVVEKLTHIDLSNLFRRSGKVYIKGKRSHNFINHLDINKIFGACGELQEGVNLISGKKRRRKC